MIKIDKVVHFEIPAEDVERAKKFYEGLFGWDIQKAGEMPYWIVKTVETDDNQMPKEAGAINGGMLKCDGENDPGSKFPTIVIDVKNTEEYCKKVESAGGKIIMEPKKVSDMGIYARIQDTEGNIIGLWQRLH